MGTPLPKSAKVGAGIGQNPGVDEKLCPDGLPGELGRPASGSWPCGLSRSWRSTRRSSKTQTCCGSGLCLHRAVKGQIKHR